MKSRPDRPPRHKEKPSGPSFNWHAAPTRTPGPRETERPRYEQPGNFSGLFRVYGRQPVIEVLKLGLVKSIEMTRHAHGHSVDELLRLARDQRIPIRRVEAFEEEGLTLQGVMALAEPPALRQDLRRFVAELPDSPPPLLLMLDGITDPHNFGAILRTALGAGVSGVIIRERRQVAITDTVVKASTGAAYLVPIFQVVNLSQTLRQLADAGYWSAAAVSGEKSLSYRNYRWDSKTVLILGAEGAGVSDLLKREADERIRIPMAGELESLNVSVATGVILFEAARARGIPPAN